MNFADVDRRYAELWQMYQSGALTAEQFDQQLHAMMIQDNQGRWWAKRAKAVTGTTSIRRTAPGCAPCRPQPHRLPCRPPHPRQPRHNPQTGRPPRTATPVPATGQTSAAAPGVQEMAYAQGYAAAPELGSGMKVLFYILSFLFGLLGIILFFVYRNKPAAEDRAAARLFLLLGVLSMLLSCLCSVTYVALFSSAILSGAGG